MNKSNDIKWIDEKLNALIPTSGSGSRFEQSGYRIGRKKS